MSYININIESIKKSLIKIQ